MEKRFFVTIIAPDELSLRRLALFELDLFPGKSKVFENQPLSIGGLLNLEAIGRIVEAGYQVLVEAESSNRAHGHKEVTSFDEWLKAMLADLESGRK